MTGGLLHDGLVRAAARDRRRSDAVRAGDDRWSFADLDRMSNAFARHLARTGRGAGDRVAVMTTNRVEFLVAVEAVSKAGRGVGADQPGVEGGRGRARRSRSPGPATPSPTAPRTAILTGPPRRRGGHRSRAHPSVGARLRRGPGAGDAVHHGRLPRRRGHPRLQLRARPDCPRRSATPTARSAGPPRTGARALGLGPDDRFQVATPPSHILGLLNLLAAVEAGATVRLHTRFDLDEVLSRIESDRMTLEMAVAPIALAMADHPGPRATRDLSSLRYIMWGATPVTESVAAVVTARTGVRWLPAYGASELPVIAANPVDDPDALAARLRRPARPTGVRAQGGRPRERGGAASGRGRRDPGPQPIADGRLPPRRGDGRACSSTAGTAPATSGGSSPRAGCTSPIGPRR